MVALYVDRINNGLMTVNDVPKLWRNKVTMALQNK